MAETIDDIAKTAPQQKKEEPKKIGTLESVVDESLHFVKSGLKLGATAAIPAAQATLMPLYARDTAVLAGAQVAGDATTDIRKGKKYTSGNALESSLVGTVTTIPTYHFFELINKIPTDTALGYVAKGSAWGGLAYPAYIGMYQFVDYIIKNKTFKGVGKYIKENYWTTVKRAWKTTFPISLLNIFFVPPILQIPISALIQYGFVLFGAPKKGEVPEEQKRDKTPYLAAATKAIGRGARNLFYAPLDLAYAAGRTLKDWYKKAPSPTTQTPAAKPA